MLTENKNLVLKKLSLLSPRKKRDRVSQEEIEREREKKRERERERERERKQGVINVGPH